MKGNRYKNLGDSMKILLIDVSKYQGTIDLEKAQWGGVEVALDSANLM